MKICSSEEVEIISSLKPCYHYKKATFFKWGSVKMIYKKILFDNVQLYQQYEPKTEIFGDIKSNNTI